MAQFETQVPNPLRENEPELLAPGGVRTPTIRILFFVLISEHGFKRPAMQVQGNHISRSERAWRQGGVEQLVDHPATRGAHGSLGQGRLVCGNDDPCAWTGWRKPEVREVKECPTGSRFRVDRLLVRWLGQAGLHLWQIEEIIVLAPHDVSESRQIRDNRSIAILPVQTHHGLVQ
jgi:hypothetical protein